MTPRIEAPAGARTPDAVRPGIAGGAEETHLRILAATREIYAGKGSRGTTTREVADRAGVNEATLFRHFGTKGQLLSAMLDHFSGGVEFPEALERIAGLATIEEQLREIARASIEGMRRKEDLIRVTMAEELTNPAAHLCAWRGPTEARRLLCSYFAEKVRNGQLRGDPQWLARVFLSLFFSLVMARRIWAELELTPESAIDDMVEIFLNGARAR